MYAQIFDYEHMQQTTDNWLTRALTHHASFKAYLEPLVQWVKPSWQAHGYQAQVLEKRPENSQDMTLVLKPSKRWAGFQAGQHLDLQVEINGRRYQRTFSISVAPNTSKQTGLIELTIRRQDHGLVTPWIHNELNTGDRVIISAARGDFLLPPSPRPVLLIAGGSGITPFRSFVQQIKHQHPDQDIHLLYYNHTAEPLFAEEWQSLAATMPGLKVTLVNTSQESRFNQQQLEQHCPDFNDRMVFLCGPYGMITSCRDLLLGLGTKEEDINHELFGPAPMQPLPFNQQAKVHFQQSNLTQATSQQPQSLLEMAEQAQLNPISGCRMGVCHTCQCRKTQGVVYNTLTQQYSDSGSEDVQLCISVPATDVTLEL